MPLSLPFALASVVVPFPGEPVLLLPSTPIRMYVLQVVCIILRTTKLMKICALMEDFKGMVGSKLVNDLVMLEMTFRRLK